MQDMTIPEIGQWLTETLEERRIVYQEIRKAFDAVKNMPRDTIEQKLERMAAFCNEADKGLKIAKQRIKTELR